MLWPNQGRALLAQVRHIRCKLLLAPDAVGPCHVIGRMPIAYRGKDERVERVLISILHELFACSRAGRGRRLFHLLFLSLHWKQNVTQFGETRVVSKV